MSIRSLIAGVLLGTTTSAGAPPEVEGAYEKGEMEIPAAAGGGTIPYRLHRAGNASPDEPRPLVVFLHGAGERGDDNQSQLRHFPDRWILESHLGRRHPAHVLAAQCPRESSWSTVKKDAADGWTLDTTAPISPELQAVMQKVLELSKDPSVDATRLYLTGLSMGGFGSWELLKHHPETFAAAVPICGGGDPDAAGVIAEGGTPIWNVHGDADRVIVVERSRDMVEAIRGRGGRLGHTELPGVGHNSWGWAYGPGGVIDWMFAQRRPAAPLPEGS